MAPLFSFSFHCWGAQITEILSINASCCFRDGAFGEGTLGEGTFGEGTLGEGTFGA